MWCVYSVASDVLFLCFKDTATTQIYTYGHNLSLHDSLPISPAEAPAPGARRADRARTMAARRRPGAGAAADGRARRHRQDHKIGRAHVRTPVTNAHLVCRLLLAKNKKNITNKVMT